MTENEGLRWLWLVWTLVAVVWVGGCVDSVGSGAEGADATAPTDAGGDEGADGDVGDSASTGDRTFEPPIYIVFKIHIEPQSTLQAYRTRRDDVEAVRQIAERWGARLTLHGNGEFWQYAAEEGDEALIRSWLEAGHDLGPHMHSVFEDPDGSHNWRSATPDQQADETFIRALWEDHHRYLAALLPELDIDQATPFNSLDDGFVEMMADFGYEIVGGGRHEISVAWFGHHPFHPWRIGDAYLEEDLDSPVIMVHHQPQITKAAMHGPPSGRVFQDQTIAHLKVQFLQIYLNRMYAERTGQPDDRIWLFGILTHDNQSDAATRAEIEEMLAWIGESFGQGRRSVRGHQIVSFATFGEVRDAFLGWESAHPGTSSFHVDTPTPIDPNDPTRISRQTSREAYPGPFWGMAQLLRATEQAVVDYVAEVDAFAEAGVECHELEFGPRDNPSVRDSRWLAFKETDGSATIDVSAMVGADRVRLYDVVDGSYEEVDAAAIEIGEEPVIFDRIDAPIAM